MVTIVRFTKNGMDNKTKAFFDIDFNGLIVKGIRIMEGAEGLFISYLREKGKDEKYYDLILPANVEVKAEIEDKLLKYYNDNK